MARGILIVTGLLALGACAHEPMDYIPPSDRTLLQAQARMGDGSVAGQPISVQDMLQRARGHADSVADGRRLVVQFSGDAATLDDAQRQSLAKYAAAAGGAPVTVTGQRAGFTGNAALLGQRRAVAVARLLSETLPVVDVRFVADLPDNIVVVAPGTSGPGSDQRGDQP